MSDSNDFGYFLAYENVVIEAHLTFTFSIRRVRDCRCPCLYNYIFACRHNHVYNCVFLRMHEMIVHLLLYIVICIQTLIHWLFMPPQRMMHQRHYVLASTVQASVPSFICSVQNIFLLLCKNNERISMKLAGVWEIITTTSRIYDYILHEIGTGTREQDTRENSNRSQLVFCDVKQMLDARHLVNAEISLHRCSYSRCICRLNFTLIWRFHLHISYKYIKNFTAILFLLSTWLLYAIPFSGRHMTDSFIHCAFLLAMATLVRKTFTMDVGQMQWQRYHMTLHCL